MRSLFINDGGWRQLEQHGISIPRKWVDDADADDSYSIESDDSSMKDDAENALDEMLFVGQDVNPDGNCLLRCFAQSGMLPYDYEEIRQALLHTARTTAPEFGKLAFERCFDDRSYATYLETSLAVDGEWTGDFEMLLFLKTFGINVVSFTMSPFGLLCFNADQYVRDAMHLPSLKTCPKTLYVLHHEYGEPLRERSEGNHFCLLLPAKKNVQHPITGALMDPSRSFHPPTKQETLQYDTSEFTGSGSKNDPLEELNDETDSRNSEEIAINQKADDTSRYRDAKGQIWSRDLLSFPSRQLMYHGGLLRESSLFRDPWFAQPMDDIRWVSHIMCDDLF